MEASPRRGFEGVRDYLLLSLITLLEAVTHFGNLYNDSHFYIKFTHYFQTGQGFDEAALYIRPLIPWLTAHLEPLLGVRNAYGFLNTILWLLSTLLLYQLALKILGDRGQALLAGLLFTTSRPILLFGASVLTDMSGYFFIIATIYLLYTRGDRWDGVVLASLTLAIGSLAREMVLVCILYAFLLLVASKKMKLSMFAVFLLISLSFIIAWTSYVGSLLNYASWYREALGVGVERGVLGPVALVRSFIGAFTLSLLYSFIGFLGEERADALKTIYLIFIPFFIFLLLIPSDIRFTFLLYPALMPLAGRGIEDLAEALNQKPILKILDKRYWVAILLLIYIISNHYIAREAFTLPI